MYEKENLVLMQQEQQKGFIMYEEENLVLMQHPAKWYL